MVMFFAQDGWSVTRDALRRGVASSLDLLGDTTLRTPLHHALQCFRFLALVAKRSYNGFARYLRIDSHSVQCRVFGAGFAVSFLRPGVCVLLKQKR